MIRQMTPPETNQSFQQTSLEETKDKYRRFGNLIVFYNSRLFTLNLGPNYMMFGITLALFCAASVVAIKIVNSISPPLWWQILNYLMCVGQCISYLLIGFSDPGVVYPNEGGVTCGKCRIKRSRHASHCHICDVCVQNRDHHCPWTSKCIGANNICRFYFFVTFIPIYIIYLMLAFAISASFNLAQTVKP